MSLASADTGDLNIESVTEASVTYQIATWSASGPPMAPGTVVFGTPNGNNLWIGAVVTLSGFGPLGSNNVNGNGQYTVTAVTASSFSARLHSGEPQRAVHPFGTRHHRSP